MNDTPDESSGASPKSCTQVLLGLGVVDLEVEGAVEILFAGVVDHHLEHRPVALAEEARQVGPDHQLLDARGLAGRRTAAQVGGDGVHPQVPIGDRVRDLELDRHRTIALDPEVRFPEGGLREVGAQLDRRFSLRRRRNIHGLVEITAAHHPLCPSASASSDAGIGAAASAISILELRHAPRPSWPGSGRGDRDRRCHNRRGGQTVAVKVRVAGQTGQARVTPRLPGNAQVVPQLTDAGAVRVERKRARRVVRAIDVEAAVVHIGEKLGGGAVDRSAVVGSNRDRKVSLVPGRILSRNEVKARSSRRSSHGTKTCAVRRISWWSRTRVRVTPKPPRSEAVIGKSTTPERPAPISRRSTRRPSR